jgi:hypothetical protein
MLVNAQARLRRIYKQRKKEALVSLKEIGRVLGRKNAHQIKTPTLSALF